MKLWKVFLLIVIFAVTTTLAKGCSSKEKTNTTAPSQVKGAVEELPELPQNKIFMKNSDYKPDYSFHPMEGESSTPLPKGERPPLVD